MYMCNVIISLELFIRTQMSLLLLASKPDQPKMSSKTTCNANDISASR